MQGVITELQKEALDESVTVESLLRKAYLAAKKLHLTEFEEWIKHEQDGYVNVKIPDYRVLGGHIKMLNPMRGWMPVVFDAEMGKIVSRMPIGASVSTITSIYESGENPLGLSPGPDLEELFNNMTDFPVPTRFSFFYDRSELYRILSKVRNTVLDWAVLLEENGILGEELSFSDAEKNKAIANPQIINYTNNFYGPVDEAKFDQ